MSSFTKEQLAEMVRDACVLESGDRFYMEDCACHIKALASEVERLAKFEMAMASMAAQMIHQKETADSMADKILASDEAVMRQE